MPSAFASFGISPKMKTRQINTRTIQNRSMNTTSMSQTNKATSLRLAKELFYPRPKQYMSIRASPMKQKELNTPTIVKDYSSGFIDKENPLKQKLRESVDSNGFGEIDRLKTIVSI